MSEPDGATGLDREGCLLRASGLSAPELEEIRQVVANAAGATGRGGSRLDLAELPDHLRRLPALESWRELISHALGGAARIVRALVFDKSLEAPWSVRWHRDTVVPLREAKAVGGFSAPTVKGGQGHARAPRVVLEHMLALRLHLDDADEANGCLLVVPGSHAEGLEPGPHPPEHILAQPAKAGEALLLRPLLLHASSKPTSPARRRVLHLDLAGPRPLPAGLDWPPEPGPRLLDS